ncbi:MAG: hypothetical protein A2496_24415 [Burkholderiales bacterium RIFOXYC12_FULL_60_6]|nr:MAG: hypothetical protein A2496_24415 [Burkholderiales bacterium RIFOXYC12_FULL_60_6]
MAGASVVSGLLQQSMAKKPQGGMAQGGYKLTSRTSQQPHRVLYGQYKLAGNEVFVEATGEDNKQLWLVQNFAEGECEGIVEIAGVPQLSLDDRIYTEYGGNIEFWFHSGAAAQTHDTNLAAAVPKWDDAKHHCAYLVAHLTYAPDYFANKPVITILLQGRKLYDIRTEATAWSDNPVLAAYDWFTSTRYGLGVDPARLDLDSWISAANYCDAKGWRLNMLIADRGNSYDTLEDILRHFRGVIVWSGGKFALRYADLNYESVAMTLTDEHIQQQAGGRASLSISQPSRYGKADGLLVKFVDAEKGYSLDDLPVGDQAGIINDLTLSGSTDKDHVAEIGTYFLERANLDRTISGVFRDDCVGLEPHDLVALTASSLALIAQFLRVQQRDRQDDGSVALVMSYEDESLYNRILDLTPENIYTCTLPDRSTPPPGVGNIQIVEENYNFRLRTFTRLLVSFTRPAAYPWFDRTEVWLSLDGGVTYTHQFDTTGDGFTLDPVEESSTYYLRLISVSIHELRTPLNQASVVSRLILGRNDAPSSLADLACIVGENSTIRAYSTQLSDPDVELYEFRLGLSWSSAIFLAALSSPNLPLPGVKPGNHTLFANTRSTGGLYGETPVSAYVSLAEPPDHWTVSATHAGDYSSGTFTNAEMVSYSGQNHLQCSHTSELLTGSYKSAVIDQGTSGRYLAYILAEAVVVGQGQTWAEVVPGSTTWAQLDVSHRWREIFQPLSAPTIRMRLWYGESNPPTNVVDRLEILSAIVEGRYYQVEIEITDPALTITGLAGPYTLKLCQ